MELSLNELFIAYRKAKAEAYRDGNVASGLKFAAFEQDLVANLEKLLPHLGEAETDYWSDAQNVGALTSIPKRPARQQPKQSRWHYFDADPLLQWQGNEDRDSPSLMPFRDIIDPTVEAQVLSALWIIHAGSHLDRLLSDRHVFANRVDRLRDASGAMKMDSHRLFRAFAEQYGKWQANGYEAISRALAENRDVVVYNFDLKDFYHEIRPGFISNEIASIEDPLGYPHAIPLTKHLLQAMSTWTRQCLGIEYGLPVGLTASGLIANVLLTPMDRELGIFGDVYYGRYVDDIFLAVSRAGEDASSTAAMDRLVSSVSCFRFNSEASTEQEVRVVVRDHPALQLSREKTSIKRLHGPAGVEILQALIEEQNARSSEQRVKPPLPSDPVELGRRALILRDGDNIQVHELRSAKSIELRRAAFTQMLRLMERYDIDLAPFDWQTIRSRFYGLIIRHCLTPDEFYTYFKRLPWVIALMVSCNDQRDWEEFVEKLVLLKEVVSPRDGLQAERFWNLLSWQLVEAVVGAAKAEDFGVVSDLSAQILRKLGSITVGDIDASALSRDLHAADWARAPYGERWIAGEPQEQLQYATPLDLLPSEVRRFQEIVTLPPFDWRPILFPTRPLSTYAITSCLPLQELPNVARYLRAFRGYGGSNLPLEYHEEAVGLQRLKVGTGGTTSRGLNPGSAVIAVASVETRNDDLLQSLAPSPPTRLSRYERIRGIVSATLRARGQVDYLVMPELCLPRRWAQGVVELLGNANISLIAGLEYKVVGHDVQNQALLALTSHSLPGLTIAIRSDKTQPAWVEKFELEHAKPQAFKFVSRSQSPLLVSHDGFCFCALICSDFTNLDLRTPLRGEIDGLFVLEWNRDTDGFSNMVASSATDLHAYIIQVNNRLFGDSWIRGPFCERYERDILRVKGGRDDFVLTGEIDFMQLRQYQLRRPEMSCEDQTKLIARLNRIRDRSHLREYSKARKFKPVPIGFKASKWRGG